MDSSERVELLFPASSPFVELIEHHQRDANKVILRDHFLHIDATAGQLLQSVAHFRSTLQSSLDAIRLNGTEENEHYRFIFMIVPIGWEYLVSMLAIMSLGCAIAPLSIVVVPEQVKQYMELAEPVAVVYARSLSNKLDSIKQAYANSSANNQRNIPFVPIETVYNNATVNFQCAVETVTPRLDRAGSLFFTSGTSGTPKGVVHSLQALLASARERIQTWELTSVDVVLNQKPGNWMGGIFAILPSLISGACLETCASVFDPPFFWERIRHGGLSVFDIASIGYDRLADYYDKEIAILPEPQREGYIRGMIDVRVAGVSGSLLQPQTQAKWTALRKGKPLLNLYGSTEVTLICSMRWQNPSYGDMCCVGEPVPGVELKLVDGEVRLKAPTMFTKYLSHDQSLTDKSFDEAGYFKTGDCASKIDNSYKLLGRASIDVLHFWGFTVFTGDVEAALLSLSYIENAVVFPVEDKVGDERVAALIQAKSSDAMETPRIVQLRKNLSQQSGLMEFKQPTVIRWLQHGEDIPLTANAKISKVAARAKYFGNGWHNDTRVEALDITTMHYWRMGGQV